MEFIKMNYETIEDAKMTNWYKYFIVIGLFQAVGIDRRDSFVI